MCLQEEYTLLFYINDDVSANAHGETAFFNEVEPRKEFVSRSEMEMEERVSQMGGQGNEEEGDDLQGFEEGEEGEQQGRGADGKLGEEGGDQEEEEGEPKPKVAYDLFAALRPKFGRIVIFHGAIPHSARPPSTDYHGIRYSFAVKLSATEQIAKVKALREVSHGTRYGAHRCLWCCSNPSLLLLTFLYNCMVCVVDGKSSYFPACYNSTQQLLYSLILANFWKVEARRLDLRHDVI